MRFLCLGVDLTPVISMSSKSPMRSSRIDIGPDISAFSSAMASARGQLTRIPTPAERELKLSCCDNPARHQGC